MSDDVQIYGGAGFGRQLKVDSSRAGVVDDGLVAWPERIEEAARQWPQGRAQDFEQIGKSLYRDSASGIEYRHVRGSPLLTLGERGRGDVSLFFVRDGKLVFLARADLPEASVIYHGPIVAGQVRNGGREVVDLVTGQTHRPNERGGFTS
jgi:hypothetical protein